MWLMLINKRMMGLNTDQNTCLKTSNYYFTLHFYIFGSLISLQKSPHAKNYLHLVYKRGCVCT